MSAGAIVSILTFPIIAKIVRAGIRIITTWVGPISQIHVYALINRWVAECPTIPPVTGVTIIAWATAASIIAPWVFVKASQFGVTTVYSAAIIICTFKRTTGVANAVDAQLLTIAEVAVIAKGRVAAESARAVIQSTGIIIITLGRLATLRIVSRETVGGTISGRKVRFS